MIIETDFPDHWKTQLLIKLTGSDAAPMLMIRFWAFCQLRRAWRFPNLSNSALAAICRWTGDPEKLRACLLESGFLTEEQGNEKITYLVAHDFEIIHSKFISNWKNGSHGGRPITQPQPNGNPTVTQIEKTDHLGKPLGVLGRLGVLGEESLEGTNTPKPPQAGASTKRSRKTNEQRTSVLPGNEPEAKRGRMLSLNAIFRRPPTDAWSGAEQLALEASGLLAMAELDFVDACETVRAFYHANIPREIAARFWKRTTLDKLLENWGGEVDKARAWTREREDGIRKV